MRRLLCGLAAATLLAQPALAAAPPRCSSVAEQSVFEVAALKSELTLLAIACKRDGDYNAFVQRYRPQLLETDKHLIAHFRKVHGARGQAEADRFITDLINAQSTAAGALGGDHCPRNSLMYSEVMALSGGADLANYAAGKNVIPASLMTCPAPRAATPARATRAAAPARPRR